MDLYFQYFWSFISLVFYAYHRVFDYYRNTESDRVRETFVLFFFFLEESVIVDFHWFYFSRNYCSDLTFRYDHPPPSCHFSIRHRRYARFARGPRLDISLLVSFCLFFVLLIAILITFDRLVICRATGKLRVTVRGCNRCCYHVDFPHHQFSNEPSCPNDEIWRKENLNTIKIHLIQISRNAMENNSCWEKIKILGLYSPWFFFGGHLIEKMVP